MSPPCSPPPTRAGPETMVWGLQMPGGNSAHMPGGTRSVHLRTKEPQHHPLGCPLPHLCACMHACMRACAHSCPYLPPQISHSQDWPVFSSITLSLTAQLSYSFSLPTKPVKVPYYDFHSYPVLIGFLLLPLNYGMLYSDITKQCSPRSC